MSLPNILDIFNKFKASAMDDDNCEILQSEIELEWSRQFHAKSSDQDPVTGQMYTDLMNDLLSTLQSGKTSPLLMRICQSMNGPQPTQSDIIVLLMCRHYSFGLDEALSNEQNSKSKKREPRDLNLDNFSRMITTCNNDLGSHILYNGPCDVIGRRVFSFVTEELELQIKYFEVFDSTIRPIHCAILLRNVTILDALTEESRQVEQIKRKNDVCNEKTFQKNLHEKDFVRRFDSNLSVEPCLVHDEEYPRFYSPLSLAAKLYIKMAHFNNYDHEREKLEEIIQILIWRQFKILVYDGSNDVVQPIVFFINQLRYFKQEQFVAKTRFESLIERLITTTSARLKKGAISKRLGDSLLFSPSRVLESEKTLMSGQFRTALQASALVNSLKLVRCVMQSLQDHQKLHTEVGNTIKTTDALTLAIWEYNIPITKTLLDNGFPLQKNKEILGRVIYNAIVMDGIKSKTIMTQMVFGKVKNKNTAIKWNLSYDDWFVRNGSFKNVKLRRFESPAVSPLVLGLLTKSVELVKALLYRGVSPDGIDFNNHLGVSIDHHPLHMVYFLAKYGAPNISQQYQTIFSSLVCADSLAKFSSPQLKDIYSWSVDLECLNSLKLNEREDPTKFILYDRDFKGLPPCLSMAMYYRFNQSGCMSADTLIDKLININQPCQNKPANVIYQILAERFSQKEFDRITEFNFPNFVWDNDGANSAIVPDFLNKGPIASNGSLIKEYFNPKSRFRSGDGPNGYVDGSVISPTPPPISDTDVLASKQAASQTDMRNDSHEDKVQIEKYLDFESYTRHLEWLIVNGERKRKKLKLEVGDILKMKGRILLSTALLGSYSVDFGLGILKQARFERINNFALSTKSKFLYEAKLAVFSNHVIDYLIEDIMDKSGVDELCAVFDAIPEDYIGFVSIFESFPY